MQREGSLVSVLLISYQAAPTLGQALDSLRSQTWQQWECILVDDGSTDHTAEVVSRYAFDPRIRPFRLERNRGRGWAQQFALDQARGDWICTLDADDWYAADKLRAQVKFLRQRPECVAVATGLVYMTSDGLPVGQYCPQRSRWNRWPPRFPYGTAMVRAQDACRTGYDPDFRRGQDFDYFCRLLEGREWASLPECLYAYRFERGTEARVVLEGLYWSCRAYAKHWGRRPLATARGVLSCRMKSALYTILHALGQWERFRRWQLGLSRTDTVSQR